MEEVWRKFFADPSQWWDHTADKAGAKYPDFKHKKTGMGLWIDGRSNPAWVKVELASMIPGSVSRSLYSWNAMLSGCLKTDRGPDCLELYNQMKVKGVQPDQFTYLRVLSACARLSALEEGKHVHAQVILSGHDSDVFIGSSLVDMYAKCGSVEDAQRVFLRMPTRNVVSWTAMLAGYVKCEEGQKALDLFELMQEDEVKPNTVTFVVVLSACASLTALDEGRRLHAQAVEIGCASDVFVGSTLVDMYAKCGSIEDAERVFPTMPTRNVVTWNAMLAGYVKCDEGPKVLELYTLMQREGVQPNAVTFVAVLNACASIMSLEEGRRVHRQVLESGCQSNMFVGNSLVDMYAKCGSMEDAQRVFHTMPTRDLVSWNAMLSGYVKCEEGQEALELFRQMEAKGVKPDHVTFVVLLNACASTMGLEEGRRVHGQIIDSGWESDVVVGTALLDMYAKCGSIEDAKRVFHKMPRRNVVSWTAMLGGFAVHGHGKQAAQLFQEMLEAGVKVNIVTFLCLLSACSHGGLVEEGILFFESMRSVYGISPTVEHYTSMVDLLGRAGRLDEAEQLVAREPKISEDRVALMALLSACRNHRNIVMGERIAQKILQLDPESASGYVLLSNIYAAAGQWASCDRVQEMRKERVVKKLPGRTWIEVDTHVHSFVANDKDHPQIEAIEEELQRLSGLMMEAGYVPHTGFAGDDEEEGQTFHVGHHSEKLAIAFGIMSTTAGTPLRLYKNLRVCVDCHTATKIMTKMLGREILARDTNRFHHFKDGVCSCGDYW